MKKRGAVLLALLRLTLLHASLSVMTFFFFVPQPAHSRGQEPDWIVHKISTVDASFSLRAKEFVLRVEPGGEKSRPRQPERRQTVCHDSVLS